MPRSRKTASARATQYLSDHLYRVEFSASQAADLEPLYAISGIDIGCRHASIRHDAAGWRLSALVSGRVLASVLTEGRWKAQVIDDQTQASRVSLRLVARGNRFGKRDALPQGTGRLVDAG